MTNYLYLTGILISVCQFVYIRLQKGQPTHTTKKGFSNRGDNSHDRIVVF